MKSRVLLLAPLLLLTASSAASTGCEAPSEPIATTSAAKLSQVDFDTRVAELRKDWNQCVAAKRCSAKDGGLVAPRSYGVSSALDWLTGAPDLCETLAPLRGLEHPYFFVGVNVTAGAGVVAQGGIDVVWDLEHQQGAAFWYRGGGLSSLGGIEAGAYLGWGFGKKAGVIDAWSGDFVTGSISVGIPVLKLAAGASGFKSPDGSVWGASVGVSGGFDFVPTPVDLSLTGGYWTPWDTGTEAMSKASFLSKSTLETTSAEIQWRDGKKETVTREYVQFASSRSLGLSMVLASPGPGGQAALVAIALDVLRSRGLTLEQACGAARGSSGGGGSADTGRGCAKLDKAACLANASACVWSDRLDPENDEFPGCSDRDLAKESEENAKKPCDGLSREACDAHPRCTWYDEDNGRIAYCTDL